jgi:hypothetical protein
MQKLVAEKVEDEMYVSCVEKLHDAAAEKLIKNKIFKIWF